MIFSTVFLGLSISHLAISSPLVDIDSQKSAQLASEQLILPQSEQLSYGFKKKSDSPEIYESEHFLTDQECDLLIEKAKSDLSRSTVVEKDSSNATIDSRRTSSSAFIDRQSEGALIQKIRKAAEELTKIPQKNGEAIQVAKYSIGAEYQPHFDYFEANSEHLKIGGQRVATLLIYLNTPEKGGETVFPEADMKITPTKGKAILFYNVDAQGKPNPKSLHGGAPVISGEKWIATLWMRENPIVTEQK